jgi:YD repeat-containing protein
MAYDRLDRLEVTTQDPGGLGLVTRHRYDPDGRLELLTDAKGQTVESEYDELGRLRLKTYAFAAVDPVRPWRHVTSTAYEHDPNDNPRRIEDRVASGTDPPSTTLVTRRVWDSSTGWRASITTLPEGQADGGLRLLRERPSAAPVTDPEAWSRAHLRRAEPASDHHHRYGTAPTRRSHATPTCPTPSGTRSSPRAASPPPTPTTGTTGSSG